MTLTIPFPPTVNHIWKASGKRRYLSSEYRAFLGLVQYQVAREHRRRMYSARLAVTIKLHAPNKRRFDIDNRVKAVLDALVRAQVFDDDEQVDDLRVLRGPIVKGGFATVDVAVIDDVY